MNAVNFGLDRIAGRRLAVLAAHAALTALLLTGAGHACSAGASGQRTFATPQKAARALFLAVRNNDEAAITAVLGARKRLVRADNAAHTRQERARFVQKYSEMRRLVREPDGTTMLYVGAENWPFPFPLTSAKGAWRFDTAAGMREILFRRIGENETSVIRECQDLVKADRPHSPGLMDGYYFRSLMTPSTTVDRAAARTPGRLAFVAYPAVYRSSGVKTFIVNEGGTVYAKDLGPGTARSERALSGIRPNATWAVEK
jgi:hypothetical protein